MPNVSLSNKKILVGCRKILCFLAVFSLTFEVCARFDDLFKFDAPFWGDYTYSRLHGKDTTGLRYNVPGARFEKWQINSHGFRGDDYTETKSPGTIRIVCLGTSETFGLYESPRSEWPAQLQRLLDSQQAEVINASVVGMGLEHYDSYFDRYISPLSPDVVIVVAGFGTLINTMKSKYEVQQHTEVNKIKHVVSATPKNTAAQLRDAFFKAIGEYRSLPKLKRVIKRLMPEWILKIVRTNKYNKTIIQQETEWRSKHNKVQDSVPDECIFSVRGELLKLVRMLTDRKIKVILVSYPSLWADKNLERFPDVFLERRADFVGLSMNGWLKASNQMNELIRSVAAESSADFMDCESAIPKTMDYFADDIHYTDQGAALLTSKFDAYLRPLFIKTQNGDKR